MASTLRVLFELSSETHRNRLDRFCRAWQNQSLPLKPPTVFLFQPCRLPRPRSPDAPPVTASVARPDWDVTWAVQSRSRSARNLRLSYLRQPHGPQPKIFAQVEHFRSAGPEVCCHRPRGTEPNHSRKP